MRIIGLSSRAAIAAAFHLAASAVTAQSPAPVRLTLGDAARAAAGRNAAVEIATLRVDEARARVREQRAALLPTASAAVIQGGRTFNTATLGINFPGSPPLFDPSGQVEGPINTTDIRGRVGQTLFDRSARERIRAAESGVIAATAQATNTGEIAAGIAAAAYVRAWRADGLLKSRIADSVLSADLLGIARELLEAGLGITLDVTRAQSQHAAVRAQLIAARNDRLRSRLELARAVGLPLDTPIALADTLGAAIIDAPSSEQSAVDAALRQRSDVRAVVEELAALRQQVGAIQSERLPTIGLFADPGLIGKVGAHLLPTYSYGVQLSVPLFDGHRRASRVAGQAAVAREAEIRERDLRAQIAVEVRSAILDQSSAREQVDAVRDRVRLGEQEVAQARDRFAAGLAGNADVITASTSLSAARTALVDAEAAYRSARVALARAEGTLTMIP